MVRMSKLTDYGIVVMTHLAKTPLAQHSAGDVASQIPVALPTVSKVLKTLTREGLLVSSRGARGGYGLARPPEQISLAEIIRALEGPIGLTECSDEPGKCVQEAMCNVRHHWVVISQAIQQTLEGISLSDMLQPLSEPPGSRPRSQAVPFRPSFRSNLSA